MVATVRALKYNGGVPKDQLSEENLEALAKGIVNLEKHIENIQKYGVPVVVTLNSFVTDTDAENEYIRRNSVKRETVNLLFLRYGKKAERAVSLWLKKYLNTLENKESHFHPLYEDGLSLKEKIETISKEIYGAGSVDLRA